jgi:FtsP/CotA-like multicopper oxidase with cupredoxin domain
VSNEIEPEHEEGTTLHWHGLTQVKTPWFDGVPGVSQCPISPGKSFTYSFQADQYGTSWYHSHYSGQYSDGLYGPMVIYGPLQPGVSYDYDLGPVMLSDYIHESYYAEMQKLFLIPPEFPNVDNNLINGIGQYDGNGNSHARFHVQSGKTYRLRLINTGGSANQKFSIDGISLTVIANDYVPVKPYTTDVVTLGIGQRTDVIFNASGSSTNLVWMRSEIDMDCLNLTATVSTAQAIIYYEDADPSATPSSTPYSWQSEQCANDPLSRTVPFYPQALPNNTYSQNVEITLGVNATGHVVFFVDGSSFRADYNYPVLLLTKQGNTSYPYSPDWNVYNFGANSSVRVVIRNTYGMQHPMHLHGQNFFVLAEGYGEWNGIVVNPANPQRRDTHILQPGSTSNASYVVLEWYQQNPGIWPLHCHTAIHVSAGLYLNVMVSSYQ